MKTPNEVWDDWILEVIKHCNENPVPLPDSVETLSDLARIGVPGAREKRDSILENNWKMAFGKRK